MSFATNAFVDCTVLVTGAGWGLGRGISHGFAGHGARVFGCDVNAQGLAETARSAPRPMDVECVDGAIRATGRVDILSNDAGGLCGQTGVPLEVVSEADFNAIFAANVTSTFLVSAAAKAAVIGLTRQLAHELGPFGITVNCVAPGMIPCNPYATAKWESLGDAEPHDAFEKIAMRRVGRPSDIANAVMFFASDSADWISGETLLVDGGR